MSTKQEVLDALAGVTERLILLGVVVSDLEEGLRPALDDAEARIQELTEVCDTATAALRVAGEELLVCLTARDEARLRVVERDGQMQEMIVANLALEADVLARIVEIESLEAQVDEQSLRPAELILALVDIYANADAVDPISSSLGRAWSQVETIKITIDELRITPAEIDAAQIAVMADAGDPTVSDPTPPVEPPTSDPTQYIVPPVAVISPSDRSLAEFHPNLIPAGNPWHRLHNHSGPLPTAANGWEVVMVDRDGSSQQTFTDSALDEILIYHINPWEHHSIALWSTAIVIWSTAPQ